MSELKEMVKKCHDVGYLTEEFAIEAIRRAKAHINGKWRIPEQAREEAVSNFSFKLW